MNLLEHVVVDNPWAAIAAVLTAAITAAGGWFMRRTAEKSAERAEEAKPALDEIKEAARLAPEVEALAAALNTLQRQIDEMQPIVKIKYPLAVSHIYMVNLRYPEVAKQIPVPGPVAEDLPKDRDE